MLILQHGVYALDDNLERILEPIQLGLKTGD